MYRSAIPRRARSGWICALLKPTSPIDIQLATQCNLPWSYDVRSFHLGRRRRAERATPSHDMASDLGLAAVMALAARVVREATEPDAVKAALGAVVCLLQRE